MELFRKVMLGAHWGVYLVNPDEATERYLVGCRLFGDESEADNFAVRLNRMAPARILTDSTQISGLKTTRIVRLVD
jgi:hypothetical protein